MGRNPTRSIDRGPEKDTENLRYSLVLTIRFRGPGSVEKAAEKAQEEDGVDDEADGEPVAAYQEWTGTIGEWFELDSNIDWYNLCIVPGKK